MNKLLSIALILLISFDSISCKNLASFASTVATITKDDENALLNAVSKLNKSGGTVYINTPIIRVSTKNTIKLSSNVAGGIVGMKQSNGAYPVIDFKNARNAGSNCKRFHY